MLFFSLEVNRRITTSITIKFLGSYIAGGDGVSVDDVLSEEELISCVVKKYPKVNKITLDLRKWQVWVLLLNRFNWRRFSDMVFGNLTCLVQLEICGNASAGDERWESLLNHILSVSPTIRKRLRSLTLINIGNAPLTFQRIGSFSSLEELRLTYTARRGSALSSNAINALAELLQILTRLKRVELSGFVFSPSSEEAAANNQYFPLVKALSIITTLEHIKVRFNIVNMEILGRVTVAALSPKEEEMINFFPRINKAGYNSLLENVEASTASDWVKVLVGVHDHLDSLYYVLRTTDPARLAKAAISEDKESTIQDRVQNLSQHLSVKNCQNLPVESIDIY